MSDGAEFLVRHNRSLEKDIAALVGRAVAERGVPISIDQALTLVDDLYPRILRLRRSSWKAHMVEMGRQVAAHGVEIVPEPLGEYPRKALFDAIADVARLTPASHAMRLDILDKDTGKLVKSPVMPTLKNRNDPQVVQRISAELSRRLGRHVTAAGRNAVAASTENGSARFKKSKQPANVGYARVLTGAESCPFCTMLASRGPVYAKDTVMTRKDGRRYHDGCDCVPVMVVEGQPWEGQAEADALYAKWQEITWRDGSPAPEQWKRWRRFVEAGGIDSREFSPLHQRNRKARIIYNGVKPKVHEQKTFEFLAESGFQVELRPVLNKPGIKTPDCLLDGVEAEVKAPISAGKESVTRLLRAGSRQSGLVIVDLHRSELSPEAALNQIEQAFRRYNRLQEVILITKSKRLIRRRRGSSNS